MELNDKQKNIIDALLCEAGVYHEPYADGLYLTLPNEKVPAVVHYHSEGKDINTQGHRTYKEYYQKAIAAIIRAVMGKLSVEDWQSEYGDSPSMDVIRLSLRFHTPHKSNRMGTFCKEGAHEAKQAIQHYMLECMDKFASEVAHIAGSNPKEMGWDINQLKKGLTACVNTPEVLEKAQLGHRPAFVGSDAGCKII